MIIDLYCERITDSLFAEPLNALSNLAFIIVGIIFLRRSREKQDLSSRHAVRLLAALVILIGISSLFFHLFASLFTMVMDTLSIVLFVIVFIIFLLKGVFRIQTIHTLLWVLSVPLLMGFFENLLGGAGIESGSYLSFVFLSVLFSFYSKGEKWKELLGIALLFSLSFCLRTIDEPLCEVNPHGTHFLWHILNAAVCYCAISLIFSGIKGGDPLRDSI